MKKLFRFIIILLLFTPIFINAKEIKYVDKVQKILNIEENKEVTVYFFHSRVCHHCINENKFLKQLEKKYKGKIKIVRYQVFENEKNANLMLKVKKEFDVSNGVPFTVIGDKYFLGYSNTIASQMDELIKSYLYNSENSKVTLPLLGTINLKKVSIPVVAIILGFIDGFNPCAMWILLLLISMLINMENKKNMWILGFSFLISSALVYLFAMLGLSVILGFTTAIIIQKVIAIIAIIGGIININSFRKTKNSGCNIINEKKRKKYIDKIKTCTNNKNFILSLIGIILLGISVNLVELSCSAGFPTLFISILNLNNIKGISTLFYLLIYIFFYLIDDLIVFIISIKTLQVTGITTKYNRVSHLIGGILMILIGMLLIFKPEWIMLNF